MEHAFAMGSGASFAAGGSNTTQLRGSDFWDSIGGGHAFYLQFFKKRGKKRRGLPLCTTLLLQGAMLRRRRRPGPSGCLQAWCVVRRLVPALVGCWTWWCEVSRRIRTCEKANVRVLELIWQMKILIIPQLSSASQLLYKLCRIVKNILVQWQYQNLWSTYWGLIFADWKLNPNSPRRVSNDMFSIFAANRLTFPNFEPKRIASTYVWTYVYLIWAVRGERCGYESVIMCRYQIIYHFSVFFSIARVALTDDNFEQSLSQSVFPTLFFHFPIIYIDPAILIDVIYV